MNCLGLVSLINDGGQSQFGNDHPYFSRYDMQCKTASDLSFITNNGACNMRAYSWNPLITVSSCINNNYNNTNGTIHYRTISETGQGNASMHRSPTSAEAEMLCTLGYSRGNSFGSNVNLNAASYSASCTNTNSISVSGGNTLNGIPAIVGNLGVDLNISGSSLLNNYASNVTFDCLQVIAGGGTLNMSSGGSSSNIVYSTNADLRNAYHVLRYSLTDGEKSSDFRYVVLKMMGGGCTEDNCQLLNNGNFDSFDGSDCQMSNMETQQCWIDLAGSGNIMSPLCAGQPMEFPTGTNLAAVEDGVSGNGTNVLLLAGNVNISGYFQEAVQQGMNQSLMPNESYRLRYSVRMISEANNNAMRIRTSFANTIQPTNFNTWNAASFNELFPFMDFPDDGQWHNYDQTILMPNISNLDVFMLGTNPASLYTPLQYAKIYCVFDDIQLTHIDNRVLQFPPNTCGSVNWNNMLNFVSPTINNGEFVINGVSQGSGDFQWSTNVPGTYTIQFNYVDAFHTCQSIQQTINVLPQPIANITFTDNNICIGETIQLTAVNNGQGNATYTWSPINITAPDAGAVVDATFNVSGFVTVTATVGPCVNFHSQFFVVTDCPPAVVTPVITNVSCYNACNGSIALTAQNPFTVVWSNGSTSPTISGLCPGTYLATISMQGFDVTQYSYVISNAPVGTLYNGNLPPINGVVTWPGNFNVTCDQDIVINANSVLNLTNGTNNVIRFTNNHGIIIKPGGTLKANYTLFTSTCGDWWNGISCQASSQTVRGMARLNQGCTVEKAIHAFMNHDGIGVGGNRGGRIEAHGVTFRNNDRDVELKTFSVNPTIDYGANFYGCTFLVNTDALTPIDADNFRVELNTNGRVNFVGCQFDNQNNTMVTTDHMKAIDGYKSCILMYETVAYPNSSIKGFDLGIDLLESGATWNNIYSTEFACYRGIYFGSQSKGRISFCDFGNMPAGMSADPIPSFDDEDLNLDGSMDDGSYGIYLVGGFNNIISDNHLAIQQEAINRYGIICINNNRQNNIHQNTFTNQKRALVCWKRNKFQDGSNDGVRITCNDFVTTTLSGYDIRVQDIGNTPNAGIAWKQMNYDQTNFSAANQFDPNGQPTCDDDYDLTAVGHRYYYFPGEGFIEYCGSVQPVQTSIQGGCPDLALPNFSISGSPIAINTALAAVDVAYSQKFGQWLSIVDGGNTDEVVDQILMADFTDAMDLYHELLSKSPALSDEAMVEAIKKEYDFPASLLTAILQANPSAAKSAAIRAELDNRTNPLTAYQRALINEGINLTSLKEALEADMVAINFHRYEICREALEALMQADVSDPNIDAQMAEVMNKEFNVYDRYLNINRQLNSGEQATALWLLEDAKTAYNLSSRQWNEYYEMIELYNLEMQWLSVPTALTATQVALLESKMMSRNDMVAQKAWSLLIGLGNGNTDDPLYDEEGAVAKSLMRLSDIPEENMATLYPNPASAFCIIKLSEPMELQRVTVSNALGQIVLETPVAAEMLEIPLETKELKSGSYFVQLWTDHNQLLNTLSLIIE
jgi:Secretion system C-terminal sorting domain